MEKNNSNPKQQPQTFKEVDLDTDNSLDGTDQGIATIKLTENTLSIEDSSDSSTRSTKSLLKDKKEKLRSSVRKFVFSNVEILFLLDSLMPILALLYDTIYPMATNYSHVIENICDNKNVDQNFWPSLSGTIGYSDRTRLIWLVFIISHAPLRFMGAFYLRTSYLKFHEKSFEFESLSVKGRKQLKQYFNLRQIIKLAHFINILEIISLCSLAIYMYFYFDKHRYGVILFLYYSFAFILLNLYVEFHLKSRGILNFFYTKVIIGILFTISFITIIVSYIYICEPYANSIFGISEMSLVITNVMYHSLSYFTIKALANMTLEEMKNRDRYVEESESSYL